MRQNIYPTQLFIRRKKDKSKPKPDPGPVFKGDIQVFVKQLKTMYSNVGNIKDGSIQGPDITMSLIDYAYCHKVLDPTAANGYFPLWIYRVTIPKQYVTKLKTEGSITLNISEASLRNPYGSRGVFYPNPYTLTGTVNTYAIGENGAFAYNSEKSILSNIAPTPTSIVPTPDGTTEATLKFNDWYAKTNQEITGVLPIIFPIINYNNQSPLHARAIVTNFTISLSDGPFKTVLDDTKDLTIIEGAMWT